MEALMTISETAHILRVKVETLRRWRYAKQGPECVKIGRKLLYSHADVEKFLRAKKALPNSEKRD